jgi:hypothetical protein
MASFAITIDTMQAEKRITAMLAKLQVVPVPAELTAWQVQDMRRRYPHTEVLSPTSAATMIYPRSRRESGWLKKKRPQRKTKPLLRGKARRIGKPILQTSHRPILRPELFDRLRERMNEMMQREITW